MRAITKPSQFIMLGTQLESFGGYITLGFSFLANQILWIRNKQKYKIKQQTTNTTIIRLILINKTGTTIIKRDQYIIQVIW